jgi:flagellar basal-body rod protein FlgC
MGFIDSLNLSASGMTAERLRMDVISNNLANVNTTQTPDGGPFRRKEVELSEAPTTFDSTLQELAQGQGGSAVMSEDNGAALAGVRVTGIVPDNSPFLEEYDPGSPDADKRGYVKKPNINVVSEMVDMMSASRAYEADVTAVDAAKGMAEKALDIGKS